MNLLFSSHYRERWGGGIKFPEILKTTGGGGWGGSWEKMDNMGKMEILAIVAV